MRRLLFLAPRLHINLIAALFCAFIIGQAPICIAQESKSISLGVNPAVIETGVRPGQTITRKLALSNQTNFSLPVSTDVESLIETNELINPKLKQQYDGSTWVRVEPESFIMSKYQVKTIPVTISVPKNATPGGHYAQISIKGLTLDGINTSGASATIVVPEITVSVLITVGGYINERLAFSSDRIFNHLNQLDTDKSFTFTVENRGNVHALVIPQLVIAKNGREYSRTALTGKVVLPNSTKEFQETWHTPSDGGMYTALIEFRHGNPLQVTASTKERFVLLPPLWHLLLVAVAAFITHYLIIHRKNLRAAIYTLVERP